MTTYTAANLSSNKTIRASVVSLAACANGLSDEDVHSISVYDPTVTISGKEESCVEGTTGNLDYVIVPENASSSAIASVTWTYGDGSIAGVTLDGTISLDPYDFYFGSSPLKAEVEWNPTLECSNDASSIVVTLVPTPVTQVNGINYLCEGDLRVLDVSTGTGEGDFTTSITWSRTDLYTGVTTLLAEDEDNDETSREIEEGGAYTATVVNSENGLVCKDSNTFEVEEFFFNQEAEIRTPLVADGYVDLFSAEAESLPYTVYGKSYVEDARHIPNVGTFGEPSYDWDYVGLGNENGLSSKDVINGVEQATYNLSETEQVIYTVNYHKCSKSDTVTIIVLPPVYIPEVFTPNGDGLYDTWEIVGLTNEYPGSELKVFNRWGGIVYKNEGGYNEEWDGTFKDRGTEVPDGVYYYILELNDPQSKMLKGNVTIIR